VKPDQEQRLIDAALVAHDVWRAETSVDGRGKGGQTVGTRGRGALMLPTPFCR
jgi:hypothetical protein